MRLAPQRRLPLSTQLVGVDGGATHVRAVHVEVEPAPGGGVRVRASGAERMRAHRQVPGFETPAELGLAGPEKLGPIGAAEREQGWAWVESTARCVLELAHERGAARVLLGIAFPGRKTADARGIEFALNGPRVPEFLEQLEQLLRSEGLEFDGELLGLQSDGWCAGVGEAHADELGNLGNGLIRHPAAMLLDHLERPNAGGAAVRIVSDFVLDLVALLLGQHERETRS